MHGVYCFTDIHGMYELYKKIMDYCKGEDPEATIIFLGDAADRGPEGYRIMKELLENPHVVYLKGNHEDMFVKSARAIIGRYAANDDLYEYVHSLNKEQAQVLVKHMQDFDVCIHLENGGMQTLVDWLADGANEEFVDAIENLPLTYKFENMDFCHAGGHPDIFETVYNAEHDGKTNTLLPYYIYQTIWDRSALDLGWTEGRTCVFGHTPVVLMPDGIYGRDKSLENVHPIMYTSPMKSNREKFPGQKINMDTGAVWSGKAWVLDCVNGVKCVEFKRD